MIKGKVKHGAFALDILISLILPFVLWRFMAPVTGDRTVIVSLVTIGLLYTISEVIIHRQLNFIVAYFLGVSLLFDLSRLIAPSTTHVLIYSIILNGILLVVHGALLVVKKPIPYWVMVTGGMRLGHTKENSKWFFQQQPFAGMLKQLTLVVMAENLVNIGLRLYYMINANITGADSIAFAEMSQISSMISIAFTIYITTSYVKLGGVAKNAKVVVTEDQPAA